MGFNSGFKGLGTGYSWSDIDRENRITWRKTCSIASLFTTNPIYTTLGSKPKRRCENSVTNHLSYGKDWVVFLL